MKRFNELPLNTERIPDGFKLIEAYAKGSEIVVPIASMLEDLAHLHDCDVEGCGSFDHVVRFSVETKYSHIEEITKISSENVLLKVLLSKIVDSISGDDQWWCPQCGTTECTFDDRCTRCGHPIGDCQPEVEWLEEAKELLGKPETLRGKDAS